MSEVYTLLLRLEGPMQSWGYRSRFDYRDTALEPTRSGVIGLICAAMGTARGEDISRFDAIRMGVRVDKQGRPERDYHTALDVIKADGKGTGTVQSWRDYLADASFTVGLQSSDKEFLNEIGGKVSITPKDLEGITDSLHAIVRGKRFGTTGRDRVIPPLIGLPSRFPGQ